MLNLLQHPWSNGNRARNGDGAPWTLKRVQGDDAYATAFYSKPHKRTFGEM